MGQTDVLNRSGQAYEELRRGIHHGRWLPDERLSTYRLADELGMSRTPVIEALKRLEADGLIEITPQVGCRILRGRREEIEEAFHIRIALEGLAAEAAAERIADEQLDELRAQIDASARAAREDDADAFAPADFALHSGIVQVSGLGHVQRLLEGVWSTHGYQLSGSGYLRMAMQGSPPEHEAIFAALEARDSTAARAAMEGHLRRGLLEYRAFMDVAARA